MNALWQIINEYHQDHALLEACQQAMQQVYPQLRLRWSRIYGSRWAFLSGSADTLGLNPARFKISLEYGICIDNVDVISPVELEEIIKILEVCFADART